MQTKNQAGATETDGRASRTPKPSRRFYKATAGGEGKVCLEGPASLNLGHAESRATCARMTSALGRELQVRGAKAMISAS